MDINTYKTIWKKRGYLIALPILIAFFIKWDEIENDIMIWPIGCFLFLIGLTLRIWAQMYCGYRLKTVPKKLVIDGPYAIVRNPIYIANTLIACALIILMELIWFLPFMLIWCFLIYNIVVKYEEYRLLQRYGDLYKNYMAKVPRWIPKLPENTKLLNINQNRLFLLRLSIISELHCLIFLLLPILKEIF